jgi:hypothetical protein
MPEPTQFKFELREVAKELLKRSKIGDGKWTIGVEFGFGATNLGPTPEDTKPAGIVMVNSLLLTRQPDDTPDNPMVLDAALLK